MDYCGGKFISACKVPGKLTGLYMYMTTSRVSLRGGIHYTDFLTTSNSHYPTCRSAETSYIITPACNVLSCHILSVAL